MKFIIKHPDAWNLYKEIPDPQSYPAHEPVPGGYEEMTDEALAAWAAEEKARGWVSAPVTDLQLRKALSAVGLRAAVESVIAAGDQNLKDDWERRLVFHRDHPLLNEKAVALGMTEAQVDAVFQLAASFL